MKNHVRSLLLSTALVFGAAFSAHAGPLILVGNFADSGAGGNPGLQTDWVEGKIGGDLLFIARTNQNGSISENPFGLLPTSIKVWNFMNPGDPEQFDILWDLSSWTYQGKQWELAAVLMKDGGMGDTLWKTNVGDGLMGGPQTVYWGPTAGFDRGSISHVSFFAREYTPPPPPQVPENGSMVGLVGFGLIAAGLLRWKLARR